MRNIWFLASRGCMYTEQHLHIQKISQKMDGQLCNTGLKLEYRNTFLSKPNSVKKMVILRSVPENL